MVNARISSRTEVAAIAFLRVHGFCRHRRDIFGGLAFSDRRVLYLLTLCGLFILCERLFEVFDALA